MRGAYWIPVITALLALPLGSCSDDDDPVKPREPAYKTLLADGPRDNVLHNLQLSCNERNLDRYDELLEEDFVFYFSPTDVQYGTVTSESWDRPAEVAAVTNLFDPNYANPSQEPAQDIDVTLVYEAGDSQWTEVTPDDPVKYPGETWYRKTVTYNLVVQLPGDFQYVGLNKQTAIVLRAATVESKQVWRLVVWRDDTGTLLRDAVHREHAGAITEETTWGHVKSLYVYNTLLADGPRDNVLHNLEQAYNGRNLSRYDELLDAGFVFYFSDDDVLNGNPEYWGRATEIGVSRNMFDPNYSNPVQEPIRDIDVVLGYPQGDDQWNSLEPEDQVTYPGETWYQKIVTYSITVTLPGDFQYIGWNKQAAFVVRAATDGSEQVWRIVLWRDDVGGGFQRAHTRSGAAGTVENGTWGRIKALYAD